MREATAQPREEGRGPAAEPLSGRGDAVLLDLDGSLLRKGPARVAIAVLTYADRAVHTDRGAVPLADPDRVARAVAVARRFEALATATMDDAEVPAVAAEFVTLGRDFVPSPTAAAPVTSSRQARMWQAYQATLSPAQQACLALVEQEYPS